MNTQLFDKTDKGREEISTRCHHLPPRMRTLLLLVDGKSTVDQVLHKVAGLGLDEAALIDLLDQQFIQEAGSSNADEQAVFDAIGVTDHDTADHGAGSSTEAEAATKTAIQLQKLHQFFTATIKSTLGVRGFPLQAKADRASSVDEFTALRDAYLAAILKAAGPEMEHILAARLEQLLQGKP